MTFFLFAMGVILVGVSARLVARAVVVPRLRIKDHLRAIGDYGFEHPIPETDLPISLRLKNLVRRSAEGLGGYMRRTMPVLPSLEKKDLTAAGYYDISPNAVHGYRAMAAIGLPGLILLLLLSSGGKFSAMEFLLLLVSFGAGWQLPSFIIRKKGTSRLDDVERMLPELIDLLIATVEAGMGFAASLNLVAERVRGALGDELRLTMKQQSLGMSMSAALDELVIRCDTPSMRAFVRTASRGETLGTSIGPVLRELSTDQRRRRRQAAREKMQKAPVKMIFPLMFLIFPALMIVLMFPAGYSLMSTFSQVGGH
jgi:tight adherence protein C